LSVGAEGDSDFLIGAYYFAGWWRNPIPAHYQLAVSPGTVIDWRKKFPEREPVTGWFSDTQEIVDREIELAAAGGIDFFAFDWYPPRQLAEQRRPGAIKNINNGLKFFRTSKNKKKMKFVIDFVNNAHFAIVSPEEWSRVLREWIDAFKDPQYLKIGGKPVLIIFSAAELRQSSKGLANSRATIDFVRRAVRRAGFPGVLIGGGLQRTGVNGDLARNFAQDGYDFFTYYNYDLELLSSRTLPYDEMMARENRLWQDFDAFSPIPYVPVVTEGWDRRATVANKGPVILTERSPEKFERLLEQAKRQVNRSRHLRINNRGSTSKMIFIYAWNEISEGGYLIPTKAEGDRYLRVVKRVFKPDDPSRTQPVRQPRINPPAVSTVPR
jgi:hypothetical protein